jgi:predicted nucleotidyltransferase
MAFGPVPSLFFNRPSRRYTNGVKREVLLAHLRKTRFAAGDRERARRDAERIASYLKGYGARVIGIGSAFSIRKPFRRSSDIDLVVEGLPPERFYHACSRAEEMTDFSLDVIPLESATPLLRERVRKEGVEL